MYQVGQAPPKPWQRVHKALADPLRIQLLEWLSERPRSARELADCAGLPADRLYYHLGQLERAGLIEVTEYRRLGRGKVERVYARAEVEPLGDDATPEESAQFLRSVLEATMMDIGVAFRAKEEKRRREVDVYRGALRLTDDALTELRDHISELAARCGPEAGGTWTRLVLALVDVQDRPHIPDVQAERSLWLMSSRRGSPVPSGPPIPNGKRPRHCSGATTPRAG